MKDKDNEFGWLVYYYPIAALFLIGLASILFGYWNPMNQVKYVNSIFVLSGLIGLGVILFRKKTMSKEYNLIYDVIFLTLSIIIESYLLQKLNELSKEISIPICLISICLPLLINFYQNVKVNILKTGMIIKI